MPSITLTNALQAVFGTTKTTGSYVPLATSAGGPDGIISMANLASVLGANGYTSGFLKVVDETGYSSLDDLPGGSITSIGNNSGKGSLPSNGRCTVITSGWTSARKQQTFIDHQTGLIYVREYINSTWQSWRTSESTLLSDSTRLASLASALGVPALYGNPGVASGTILEYNGGYALIKISDVSMGKNALFLQAVNSTTSMTMIAGDQNRFSTTKDTNGKINVYGVSEYKFAVQQNTSSATTMTVAIICQRG